MTLTPNGAWGGEGSLGCGIGYGYLHRIPTDAKPEDHPSPPATSKPSHTHASSTSHTVMPIVPPMMSPPMVGTMPPPPPTTHAGFQHQFGTRSSPSPSPPSSGAVAPPPSEVSSDISSPPSAMTSPTPAAAQIPIFGTGDQFNRSGTSTPSGSPWTPSSNNSSSTLPSNQQHQQPPIYRGFEMMAPIPPPNLPIPDPAVLAGLPIPPMAPAISANPLPNFSNLSFTSDQDHS